MQANGTDPNLPCCGDATTHVNNALDRLVADIAVARVSFTDDPLLATMALMDLQRGAEFLGQLTASDIEKNPDLTRFTVDTLYVAQSEQGFVNQKCFGA